jgi:flagellar biogenesis protein FliO
MRFGKKGVQLTLQTIVKLIIVIAIVFFLFYFLEKIMYAGKLFISMFG